VVPVITVDDARVRGPARIRDVLMHLACVRAVNAHRTDTIHVEWFQNLLANRPGLTHAQVAWTRALRVRTVTDALARGDRSRAGGEDK
jgi:hypothetical protein